MKDAKKILLALKDKEAVEEFKGILEKGGWRALTAQNGVKAMETALKEDLALIVADLDLPLIGGERLFRILRNNPHTSRLPFLFVSDPPALEIRGFRPGTDVYITRPFLRDEVYGNIKEILLATDEPHDDKVIQGRLSQVPLVDIIQMLHMNKKEGVLVVRSDRGGTASVFIKEGRIYDAKCAGTEKEKALFRILTWNDGTFEFRPVPVAVPPRIRGTTGQLLMEAMRQQDEFENSKAAFPPETSLLKTAVDTSKLPDGLKPIMYEILSLVRYYPRVKDIVDRSSFTDYETYRTISSLLDRGILKEVESATPDAEGAGGPISPTQALRIKEKVVSRWSDMLGVDFGRIFVAASSGSLLDELLLATGDIPGFTQGSPSSINPGTEEDTAGGKAIGEIGTLKLYGGMDIIFFAVPLADKMAPLLNAFSSNLIGLMLLWDEDDEDVLNALAAIKDEVLSRRRVPVVHIYGGKEQPDKTAAKHYRDALKMKQDETLFSLAPKGSVFRIFKSYFNMLLKEDYISSRVSSA